MKRTEDLTVKILLVEDDPDQADFIRLLFHRADALQVELHHVETVGDAESALATNDFDLVMLDLGLPDNAGIDAVRRMAAAGPDVPIFVVTGDERRETAMQAIQAGAQDFLPKQHLVGHLLIRMTEHSILRQRRLRSAERAALTDPLTGLGNRMSLTKAMGLQPNEPSARLSRWTHALLIDIDHFKPINDQYGHDAGDQVIMSVAKALSNFAMNGDLAMNGNHARSDAFVCRYGGEEFAMLICAEGDSDVEIEACVWDWMDRVRELSRDWTPTDVPRPVTVSIGATPILASDQERQVFLRADAALYTSKSGGRNRSSLHDGSVIHCTRRQRTVAAELV